MLKVAIFALPMALIWMTLTSKLSLDSFVIGYLLGFGILRLVRAQEANVDVRRLPQQAYAALIYTLLLTRDVVLSSFDVARRVLSPNMPLQPGVVKISTQDDSENPDQAIAALSAHAITITPGGLVVEFDKDGHTLYVHCLHIPELVPPMEKEQTRRLKLMRRILGYDRTERTG